MMRKNKIAMVVTTVGSGSFLAGYCGQAEREGVKDRLKIIVIPDKNSPKTLYEKCASFAASGFDITCPEIPQQDDYLRRFGGLVRRIPYNSDNRRNVGFLMALDWGCDAMVSLDDDNYCPEAKNVFADYALVCGDETESLTVRSDNGWFNACGMLEVEPDYPVFPRGFPYNKREKTALKFKKEKVRIRLNAGLWLEEPDMDAISWLAVPVKVKSFDGRPLVLAEDTWAPVNSQNTSLHRDLIANYYFVRMGNTIAGMSIDRYGDIFSGYFCQACARHLGQRIRVGTPVSIHRRNSHDYVRDLARELACVWILEDLTGWLREVKLEGNSNEEAYLSLADALDSQVGKFKGLIWKRETRDFFRQTTRCMRQWVSACRKIG